MTVHLTGGTGNRFLWPADWPSLFESEIATIVTDCQKISLYYPDGTSVATYIPGFNIPGSSKDMLIVPGSDIAIFLPTDFDLDLSTEPEQEWWMIPVVIVVGIVILYLILPRKKK